MSAELKVIGYLNRFERDVMPVVATPVFQSGSRRYVRERSGAREIDTNEMFELEDRGWITWFDVGVVSSDEGRFLLHENVADLRQDNRPAALDQPYLLPAEERTRRTELANAYLDRAIAVLHKISGNDVYENDARFEDAMIELERTARARPEMLAVRVLQAAIADYFDNPSWVSTAMEEFRFELSRCGMSRWDINLSEHLDFGRGWKDFRISENGLFVNVTPDDRFSRMGYESNVAVDKFSLRWFCGVAKLVHDCPWLAAYGNLLKTASLFQLLVLHVRGQPIEEASTEPLKHYLAAMPVKSSEIKVSLGSDYLDFSLWSVPIDSETKSVARANALAGRLIGMLAAAIGNEKSIENIANILGSKLTDSNTIAYDRLKDSKALIEMEGNRQGGRELERELVNRSYAMKVYKDLELPEEAHEEARLMAARADYPCLSQAYADSLFNVRNHKNIGHAIENVGYAYTQLGLIHFGVSAYEAAEDSFDKARQYLQLPMDDVRSRQEKPTRRLLDRLAFSTYMLALLQSDRVQAGKAVDYYDELDSLYGELTHWQNKCRRVADALKKCKDSGDQDAWEFIRNALDVVGSSDLATLKAKVRKLYGWSIGRGNDSNDFIVNPENYESLLNDLANLHQDRPNDDEIAIMLLKARVAIFKAVLNKLLLGNYDTPGYTLSELSAKNQATELRNLLQTIKLAEKINDTVFIQRHAHELLAKYFLHSNNFEMARQHNDSLIELNEEGDDLIATMRRLIIDGAIATTQRQVFVAAKSLEKSAAEHEKLGNAGEAARRYFGAGAICSSAIYRFKRNDSDSLLDSAINLYRKAVTSKRPPHTAAVYRLAENLYLFGKSSEAMTHLARIDETDWRAAVLYARIVCSSPELKPTIPVAENRLTIALRSFLQKQLHSRTTFCRLVDAGCSLRALPRSPPQMTEPEWLDVMRVAANDQGIFGAGLNVLLHHRVLTVGLAEFCNKTLQKPRSDTREILRYYLGYIANKGSGNSAQVRQLSLGTDVLKPEDIIAIVPDMKKIIGDAGRSEWQDLLKENRLWGPEFDQWLSNVKSSEKLNSSVLDAAKSVAPKLVSTQKLRGMFELINEPKQDQLIWGDVTALNKLCRVLNNSKLPIHKPAFHIGVDGISYHIPESAKQIAVESDAVIQYSAIRSGGKYLATDREIRLAFQGSS